MIFVKYNIPTIPGASAPAQATFEDIMYSRGNDIIFNRFLTESIFAAFITTVNYCQAPFPFALTWEPN